MNRKFQRITLILLSLIFLAGCRNTDNIINDTLGQEETKSPASNFPELSGDETHSAETEPTDDTTAAVPSSEMFTDRDMDYWHDDEESVMVKLNGDSVSCDSKSVAIKGTTVTIKDAGTYFLVGELYDGKVVVNADENDKVRLVLGAVTINCSTSAPIYVLRADKVFVTLDMHTVSTLSNGGEFVAIDENNINAVIYSKQDITFNGENARLVINSPAGHGIAGKDDVVFTSGQYEINSAGHGIDANDSVRVVNAGIKIDSGKDGIHVENSDDGTLGFVYIESGNLNITSAGDGISAGAYMDILGGTFNITAGGGYVNGEQKTSDMWGMGGFMGGGGRPGGPGGRGETPHGMQGNATETTEDSTSIKGIKSAGNLTISGGTFITDSADDAVHSNASITINGGTFDLQSGDDGIHADETLTVRSAAITIAESYEGFEALDIKIEGGAINLVASDDGLNAAGGTDSSGFGGNRGGDKFGGGFGGMGMGSSNGSIVISGGTLYIKASGDGIDANGTVEISGGYTVVCGPTAGDTATLDYDTTATINGGTFIGTGAYGMAQTFNDTKQGVIAVSVGNQQAGDEIVLKDKAGNVILTCTPELSYAVVILSSPEIISGETYTLNVGSLSGEIEAQ